MTERNQGRPWTAREDHLLTQAVALHGENDNWKMIALAVPERTNKACRKRWLHSLSPTVKKTSWTSDEDQLLLDLFAAYGPKWSAIARQIPGRTDDACSKRYREALDPSLRKDEWTVEEDEKLAKVYGRLGGRWGQVGHELNRSGLACRNRWRMLERKRAAASARQPSQSSPIFFQADLEEPSPIMDQGYIPWQNSYITGQHAGWPSYLFDGAVYPVHPELSSPILSQDFSPASTLLDLSPISHDIPLSDPQIIPPFQYSSSSLSAALSPSPALERLDVLPESTPVPDHPNHSNHNQSFQSLPQVSGSSSQFAFPHDNNIDTCMPRTGLAEIYNVTGNSAVLSTSHPNAYNTDFEVNANGHLSDSSPNVHTQERFLYGTRGENHSAGSLPNHGGTPPFSPSPICLEALTLSPMPSPARSVPIDLPSSGLAPHTSTLFSPPGSDQPLREKKPRRSLSQGPLRLSSNLPLSPDSSILPYTCGYDKCRSLDGSSAGVCFATSKDLSDHCKMEHPDRSADDRPYRCGLDGCGKSWKSVNGLQYHLQISRAHFQHAISSTLSSKPLEGDEQATSDGEGQKKLRKLYTCSQPQCARVYRQLSGLRYHLLHGHPREMPVQLEVVPPTLARKVAGQLKAKEPQAGI